MKKQLIIIGLLLSVLVVLNGQKRMNESRTMKEKHIDFTEEVIYFELSGFIEIDGHIFKNDTCKCPIIYTADFDGITIMDTCTKTKYMRRICDKPGCKILHLTKIEVTLTDPYEQFYLDDRWLDVTPNIIPL